MLIELDPVDRITADAVGEPGHRVFFLQGRKGSQLVTVLMEKQQVELLSVSLIELLSQLGKETGEGPPEAAMGLEEPVVPEWRAGRLSIGYEEDRDLLLLEIQELVIEEAPEDEGDEEDEEAEPTLTMAEFGVIIPGLTSPEIEEEEEQPGPEEVEALERALAGLEVEPPEGERVRFWCTREQMAALARHGAEVCSSGRPRCQLCGNPIDPEGHQCPAMNGHRKLGE
ncbi:MAG TPA: hypothetical protein DIT48_09040 [Actinobacteria bacterium]|nr:hypothetical protein [Actinomycetota bacterium]HCP62798.1 hypothetical protein [Actinomycetota bacterium]